jgi:quercetin dioxygenase-like cupin family protein
MRMRLSGTSGRRGCLAAVPVAALCLVGDAAPAAPAAAVTTLLQRELADLPGKEALVLTVEYPPGGASMPHRHDADVLVYVLAGEVIMQLAGQPPLTLGPGATFFEGPGDVHVRSANASTTAPAKFLVFMVKDKGRPSSRPAAAPPATGDRR